ncbi:MAG: bifunctional glutamate N-acetyltransferase/amino-acid acetyltransferase ArgJ [Candidatus Omnitrophica bacterium]|nr:bifunctional glutamate N-acetyltransferase/amino-acid acetyltransferase ArgJ [Candidatus Omnitrophota bacterium]
MKKFKLPKGFFANGIHCGVKRKRKDLVLLYSEKACKIAAIFTKNVVKAAPVILAIKQLKKNKPIRGVVINSGNANCMTGKRGMEDAKKMTVEMAKILRVHKDEILVSSTGIIGEFMDMRPITKGMKEIVKGLSADGTQDAAEGIMTTDRFPKISERTFTIGGKKIKMVGIAKGAGMIKPDMATMLCYILTDANISKKALKVALSESAEKSFNSVSVDGDMSTNDTVQLLANGLAGNVMIKEKGKDFENFKKNLNSISDELAKMIVLDGEGANKFVEVKVKKAKTKADAKKIAEAVASSLLVKCAVLGGDPNWGRVASSAGASGVNFNPDKIEIILDGVVYFKNGKTLPHENRKRSSVFKGKDVKIEVSLNAGKAEASFFSCDISKKYITLNSYYTT